MKRFSSIKKNRDFQNIYDTGKSYANRQLVMYVSENFLRIPELEYPSARKWETA